MSERSDPGDERILELYRRAPRPEPPERLDRAIRAAARAAVRRPRHPWLLPTLATAAVLVLTVNLVLVRPALQDTDTVHERPAMPPPPAPRSLGPSPGASPKPLAREPARYRTKDRGCPPLPSEFPSDRTLLERKVAELLQAGLWQEAECLLLQLDGLPLEGKGNPNTGSKPRSPDAGNGPEVIMPTPPFSTP